MADVIISVLSDDRTEGQCQAVAKSMHGTVHVRWAAFEDAGSPHRQVMNFVRHMDEAYRSALGGWPSPINFYVVGGPERTPEYDALVEAFHDLMQIVAKQKGVSYEAILVDGSDRLAEAVHKRGYERRFWNARPIR